MNIILTIIVTSSFTWFILYLSFYSPKAQVNRLWKRVFRNSKEIGISRSDEVKIILRGQNKRIGNLINSILDCHIRTDRSFNKENKY